MRSTNQFNKKRGRSPLVVAGGNAAMTKQPTSNRLMEETLAASQRRREVLAKALAEARDVMKKVARGVTSPSALVSVAISIDKVLKEG